jgi:hypothetical protein
MRPLRILALAVTAAAFMVVASPAQAATVQMTSTMTADEEVPQKGPAGATGSATLDFKTDTNEVCYTFVTQNLSDALTSGHIHKGAKGMAGDVFIDLQVTAGKLTGCVPSDAAKMQAVLANPQGHYVNLHTQSNPQGAVRGQLLAAITNPQAAVPESQSGAPASESGAPAIARTGPGSIGLLVAISFGLLSAGAAARLSARRR